MVSEIMSEFLILNQFFSYASQEDLTRFSNSSEKLRELSSLNECELCIGSVNHIRNTVEELTKLEVFDIIVSFAEYGDRMMMMLQGLNYELAKAIKDTHKTPSYLQKGMQLKSREQSDSKIYGNRAGQFGSGSRSAQLGNPFKLLYSV